MPHDKRVLSDCPTRYASCLPTGPGHQAFKKS